ncbi:medium-chain acyl-CoA ligase ACSF2, mitochondrial isoform X2 [Latimeria chalumnae]|uniref:Medium-chain acyl-CoA ligase ACSF2, mitochondrial n=1 Tax=Latimeria chalumnae TaxID=7897 RepID=H3B4A0_LATCH|nr:PREDICTED: acyl-CoA synthetase family member 2, mitochondrial isoform X2 [Latimeria chalumnae]|eukprot:XP_005999663.1 PREDICTED: acyl-CoA synthetase family member 2, mitochondrial isoform X2 [Latimeria chalumnae]
MGLRKAFFQMLGSSMTFCFRMLLADYPPTRPMLSISYAHGTSDTPLLPKTVGQCLDETVSRYPDKEALVFVRDGIRKTFSQLKQDVDQLAAGLLVLGLNKGDRLGMWGPNTYDWVLMQFATAQAGIIMVTVNPAYQSQELEHALKNTGCKAIVFPSQFKTQKYYEILKQICPEVEKSSPGGITSKRLPDLKIAIVLDSKLPGAFQMDEVMQAGSSTHHEQLRAIQKKLSFDDPIMIQFTSGTTGRPKGATLSHHNIVNNSNLIGRRMGFHWRDTRICLPVPLYHCFGSVGGSLIMVLHASTNVFPSPGYDGRAVLETIEKEKCTVIYGTPTMFIDMLRELELSEFNLSSLEAGIVAGASAPPEVCRNIINKMKVPELTIGYGTTENSPVTFLGFHLDEINRKTETVGYIAAHTEAKVVNPNTGEILPLNTSGELWIRGYCVMLHYWGQPEKTREVITPENWYKTGDICTLDKFGYCKVIGRIKDMIIRGGENIYPVEIEEFLHTHPKAQEVQVIGVKDERMGEEVCACIRLKEGQECTAEEIKAYCKGKISHFKIPRFVLFVTDYPLTVSGKVQKYKLREMVEDKLGL